MPLLWPNLRHPYLKMKKIIIPTDFSETAHRAARYALTLFGDSATYTLVNAYQVPHSGSTMLLSIADILKRDSEQLLKEQLIKLEDEFPQLTDRLSVVAEMGPADLVLRKLVTHNGIDLVVMGTTGATGLKGALVGSVASGVMQQVPCAVLAIPSGMEPHMPKKILLAADDHSIAQDHCPEALSYIAGRTSAKVMIMNVLGEGESTGSSDRVPVNKFDGIDHSYHFEKGKNVGETITSFAQEADVDLLAMVRRKKDLFANLFGHSNTREMIRKTKLPLLVLPSDLAS
jgi:nucleotide-binding universal stress UspA family protein